MKVGLVVGSESTSGISRYARDLHQTMKRRGEPQVTLLPLGTRVPGARTVRRALKLDIERFLTTYPLRPIRGDVDLFHLTYQTLASSLWCRPKQPIIVTVHDIFPYLYRSDRVLNSYSHSVHRWMDFWAMRHLRRAQAIITPCEEVRQNVVHRLRVPPCAVHTIPHGVDHALFRPKAVASDFCKRYILDVGAQYVLHVSSEDPRKNVPTLLRAWRAVTDRVPDAVLLKVGRPAYPSERLRMLQMVTAMGLERSVRFIDEVPNADLVNFYNIASVLAFPSISEGFGFPVLEAMACGTPVVCSDTPALRELTADAALHAPATSAELLASQLVRVLLDRDLRLRLRAAGDARAALYTWDRTAEATYQIYVKVHGES